LHKYVRGSVRAPGAIDDHGAGTVQEAHPMRDVGADGMQDDVPEVPDVRVHQRWREGDWDDFE